MRQAAWLLLLLLASCGSAPKDPVAEHRQLQRAQCQRLGYHAGDPAFQDCLATIDQRMKDVANSRIGMPSGNCTIALGRMVQCK